jgi:acyl carrier protein
VIDSFHLAHIAAFIETEYGVYVPDGDLATSAFDSLRGMAQHVVGLLRPGAR